MSEQLFINPYNFIPFGSSIEKKRRSRESVYRAGEPLVSGWLTVKLETKTPLIIPDGARPKCKEKKYVEAPGPEQKNNLHKEFDFLRILGKNDGKAGMPIIPGSELRGMLRSIYEAATDSCVPFLLDDKPISQRVPALASLRKRGLLAYENVRGENDRQRWVLYSAKAERCEAEVKQNGEIRCGNGKIVRKKNGDYVEGHGWLQYNIPVKKENYHITYLTPQRPVYIWDFVKENGEPDQERNEEAYRSLKTALDRQGRRKNSPNEGPNRNLAKALERAKEKKGNMVPVYYFTVKRGTETLVYLSNSSIGRIAQRRKWKEIMGVHAPCESTDKLCPACLLFGTINGKGMKGHVRVTDAMPEGEWKPEIHTLQILGEPRTSAFEFYLKKPRENRVTYWNFDFYGKNVQVPGERLTRTEYYDLGEAAPRGRKLYWHSPPAPDASKNHMNATMEAMQGRFTFRIYFDQITNQQLQDLIWVITLGENREDSMKQHKLGHAKPLGYGSVKLVVTEKMVRLIAAEKDTLKVRLERTDGDNLQTEPGGNTDLNSDAMENLLRICDVRSVPKNVPVMYPKALNKKYIYTWFAENRKESKYMQILPDVLDKELTLSGSWNEREKIPSRMEGRVKFFKADQNFGYITGKDGQEYKVNINSYNPNIRPEDLRKGRSVTFIPKEIRGNKVANQCELK